MKKTLAPFWHFALVFVIAFALSAGSARAQIISLPLPADTTINAPTIIEPVVIPEAESRGLNIPGYTKLALNVLSRTTPALLFGANEKPSLTGFIAVRDWHSKSKKIVYAQMGLAGKFQNGSKPTLQLIPLTVNIFALSAKLFNWKWALEHSTAHPMPDIFLGPAVGVQLDGAVLDNIRNYQPKSNTYLMLYIRGL